MGLWRLKDGLKTAFRIDRQWRVITLFLHETEWVATWVAEIEAIFIWNRLVRMAEKRAAFYRGGLDVGYEKKIEAEIRKRQMKGFYPK